MTRILRGNSSFARNNRIIKDKEERCAGWGQIKLLLPIVAGQEGEAQGSRAEGEHVEWRDGPVTKKGYDAGNVEQSLVIIEARRLRRHLCGGKNLSNGRL